uniref:Probable cytochrome P450 313a2 n=1 Tax=Drosophila rhopaloa TaxID=1041015 RepID=A0A6P4FFI3_DRORH
MLAVHFLIVAGIFLWIRFLWSRRRFYMLMWQLPGPMGLPLLGVAVNIIMNKRKMSLRGQYMDHYGSTIFSWLGPVPILVTRDPKIIKDILTSSHCLNKSLSMVNAMGNCIGFGLVTLRGMEISKWDVRRKQINPAFKHSAMLSFIPVFNDESKTLVTFMDTFVGQGEKDVLPDMLRWSFRTAIKTTIGSDMQEDENFKDDKLLQSYQSAMLSFIPVFNDESKTLVTFMDTFVGQGEKDVLPDMLRWSFRTAIKTTIGSDMQEDENFKDDKLLQSYQSIIGLITINVIMPLVQNKFIAKLCGFEKKRLKHVLMINKTLQNIIDKKLKCKEENNTASISNTVINRAIDLFRNGDVSYEEVKSECSNMVLAAFETTGLTVWHTMILLAMFPDCQDIAFEELKKVFPTNGDFEVTDEDLHKLEYLDRVLSETLRLIPPIPVAPRETSGDLHLSNGVTIPKEVVIAIDIFSTHRNPDIWGSEAETFNPDNFLQENILERHPYAYIPFSRGKRNCIGWKYALMSVKLALAKILRNYKISTSFRYEDLVFVDNTAMKLAESPKLQFERRN